MKQIISSTMVKVFYHEGRYFKEISQQEAVSYGSMAKASNEGFQGYANLSADEHDRIIRGTD